MIKNEFKVGDRVDIRNIDRTGLCEDSEERPELPLRTHMSPKKPSDFLTESLNPSKFPFAQKDAPTELAKFLASVAEFDGKPIPNPSMSNIKYQAEKLVNKTVNYDNDPAFAVQYRALAQAGQQSRVVDPWDYDFMYPHQLPGKLKKMEKDAKGATGFRKEFFNYFLPRYREMNQVAEWMEAAKERVFKRQPKTEAEKAAEKQKFFAPMAKMESGIRVTKVLTELTDDLKVRYAASLADWWTRQSESYSAMSWEEQQVNKKYNMQILQMREVWTQEKANPDIEARRRFHVFGEASVYKLNKASAKLVFKKEAKRASEDMQQAFLAKNVQKLVSILERKGIALKNDPTIDRSNASQGVFDGDITITFADDSKFMVRNKVILKQNQYGTVFNQFPTTFHDVVLPDGSKMGAPNEERMNEVFAGAK